MVGGKFLAICFVTGALSGRPAVSYAGLGQESGSNAALPDAAEPTGVCVGQCEPAPPLPPCDLDDKESQNLCGRSVKILRICPQGPPPVTPAMAAEIPQHKELQGEEEMFGCVSWKEGADCKANPSREGDGNLGPELESLHLNDTEETQKRFHRLVTSVPFEDARDDAALVAKRGFSRDITHQHLLYRSDEHGNFHANAAGVNLAQRAALLKESKAQRELAELLEDLQSKFSALNDGASAKSTGLYSRLARNRAEVADALACDLLQKAEVNEDRQRRLASVNAGATATFGTSASGGAASGVPSDVTGVNDSPPGLKDGRGSDKLARNPASTAAEPEATAHGEQSKSADPLQEILASYGGYRFTLEKPPVNLEADLFTRVRAKHREKEATGTFRQSIVDGGDPVQLP